MSRPTTTVVLAIIMFCIFINLNLNSAVQLKLTNLQCDAVDPSFLTYRLCKLKVIRRGVVALNVDVELHKIATSCVILTGLYKKASGYKPFLYNTTLDFCNFKAEGRINLLNKLLLNFISEFTNANHTCPYEHNIIVKDLTLSEEKFKLVPLPTGEYMKKLAFIVNGQLRTSVKVFFTRIE